MNQREIPPDEQSRIPVADAVPASLAARLQTRFFYGWIVVAAGFCAQMISSLSMQGLAVYSLPLKLEFGWSAGQTAFGRSVQTIDTLIGPIGGILVDRFGAKRLMVTGTVVYFVAFAILSTMQSLPGFYLACFLMGLANSLLGLLVVSQLINNWFSQKRSTAMGLAVAGFAVAGFVLLPLVVLAESLVGWRYTAFGTGCVILVIGLPMMLLVRSGPEALGLHPDGKPLPPVRAMNGAASTEGFSLRQALKIRAFWYITAALAVANFHQAALIVHLFPYLETISGRAMATLFLAEVNVFNLAGRVVGGMLGDSLPKGTLLGVSLIAATAALVLLAVSPAPPAIALFAAIFGFTWGTRTAVSNALIGDYFGRRSFGKIAGLAQTFAAVTSIISPFAVGIMLDRSTSFPAIFLMLAALTIISAAFFFLARRPA